MPNSVRNNKQPLKDPVIKKIVTKGAERMINVLLKYSTISKRNKPITNLL